jgi:hypothetical protein
LIVWCRIASIKSSPTRRRWLPEMAARYGAETPVLDWRDRLVCSKCGGRQETLRARTRA